MAPRLVSAIAAVLLCAAPAGAAPRTAALHADDVVTDGRSQALLSGPSGPRVLDDGVAPGDARLLTGLPRCPMGAWPAA